MSTENELLYVVDDENRPIAAMEMEQIHRQGLMHRGVYLLLRIERDRLVLRRRSPEEAFYPGRWDLVGCSHVPAHSSTLETATMFIPQALQQADLPVVQLAELTPAAETDNEFVTIFQIRVPPRLAKHITENAQYMSVDRDELDSLIHNYPDQLAPSVSIVWQSGIAFGPS